MSSLGPDVPYSKELRLLNHVFQTATGGDPLSIVKAIEDFGDNVLGQTGLWLKVAGGSKSEVLANAVRNAPKHGSILEIGTYCGYSAIRMAIACPGTRVVSVEADPAHMIIARNIVAFAGLSDTIDVWTGHSKDLLYRIHLRYKGHGDDNLKFRAVFMDQRGSWYTEDLETLENH